MRFASLALIGLSLLLLGTIGCTKSVLVVPVDESQAVFASARVFVDGQQAGVGATSVNASKPRLE